MALLGVAASEEEIKLLNAKLLTLFRASEEAEAQRRAREKTDAPDRSEANDNAAGLRGGGAAIEHVRKMMMSARPGYVALFRLCCLDVVGERFGVEGIQDCLMAVSAFLIQNLRREDVVYHWSESSLLAVCDRAVREDILAAELNRLLAHNRDLHITIGDRTIMLRIPIELQLFPISRFNSPDDLQSLPIDRSMAKARGASAGMGLVRA
jgi:GGDEF domain-containing protein